MKDHTKALGRIVSYAAAIGYEYNGQIGDDGTRFVSVFPPGSKVTIACWPDLDFFTAMSVRKVSNVTGRSAEDSIPVVEAENAYPELVDQYTPSDARVEPIVTKGSDGAIEYLEGVRVKSLLFVYDDSFSMEEFDNIIRSLDDNCRRLFNAMEDEFEYELDVDEEAAAEDDDEPTRTAFQ